MFFIINYKMCLIIYYPDYGILCVHVFHIANDIKLIRLFVLIEI